MTAPSATAASARATKAEVLERLRAFRERFDEVPGDVIGQLAELAGRDPRTVRRWLAEAERRQDRRHTRRTLRPAEREAVAATHGIGTAYDALGGRDALGISRTTFWRRFHGLAPAVQAGLLGGVHAMPNAQLFTRYEAAARNECWQIDHTGVPLWLLANGQPAKATLTSVIDDHTRLVLGCVLTVGTPNASVIAWCLAGAMRRRETDDGHPVGGICARLRTDRGRDFIGGMIAEGARRALLVLDAVTPYAGWEKGKIERWHRTIKEMFFGRLPGFTEGALDERSRHYFVPPEGELLPLEVVVAKLHAWLRWYNAEKPHRSLGGRTPLQAWVEDPTPLRFPTDALLHRLVLRGGTRIVQKDGMHIAGRIYNGACLADWVGRRLPYGAWQDDSERVEVFHPTTDEFLGECSTGMDPVLARAVRKIRRRQVAQVETVQRQAARQAQIDAIREPGRPHRIGTPGPRQKARGDVGALFALIEGGA